ncbi:lactate utilization protein C [Streptomyces sp. NPDC093589]|uniref:LutC/YkgG family protein n=1 Tax=Streptomyces sp. NPDC093589 TaxID=3366043 RepID=UPI003800EB64
MSSRETVLGRVRRALSDVPREEKPQDVAVPRDYLRVHGRRTPAQTVDLLAENLADYRALVHRCPDERALPALIGDLLTARAAARVLVPGGLPTAWTADIAAEVVRDDPASPTRELDTLDSVVTGCAVAVAESGTIVLDAGPGQGRRRITLIPDHHICVVRTADQVVGSVGEGLERLDPTSPQTWISGPSATSDIELDRVEGVHGPRTLAVVLLGG